MAERRSPSAVRVVASATLGMLVAAWPPFLVAVLAVPMGTIRVDTTIVALGIALFFTLAAVLSPLGGRVAASMGPQGTVRLVAAGSMLACCLIAVAPGRALVLVALVLQSRLWRVSAA